MARSTPVIAAVGAGLLVVAVAAVAIRGTGDTDPEVQPTDAVLATGTPTDTTPTDDMTTPSQPAPTTDETATDAPDDDGTFVPTAPPTDGTATDDGTGDGDGTDDDGTDDDGTSDGDTGDDTTVDPSDTGELPDTGGGALAILGAALAAGGALSARRRPGA